MTGLLDPADLAPAERARLEAIATRFYRRVPKGYRVPGTNNTITLKMVRRLMAMGLVRPANERGHPTIVLTGRGRDVFDIIQARRERKNG